MQGGDLFRPVIMLKEINLLCCSINQSVAVLLLVSRVGCSNINFVVRIRSTRSDESCHQEAVPINIYQRHLFGGFMSTEDIITSLFYSIHTHQYNV